MCSCGMMNVVRLWMICSQLLYDSWSISGARCNNKHCLQVTLTMCTLLEANPGSNIPRGTWHFETITSTFVCIIIRQPPIDIGGGGLLWLDPNYFTQILILKFFSVQCKSQCIYFAYIALTPFPNWNKKMFFLDKHETQSVCTKKHVPFCPPPRPPPKY